MEEKRHNEFIGTLETGFNFCSRQHALAVAKKNAGDGGDDDIEWTRVEMNRIEKRLNSFAKAAGAKLAYTYRTHEIRENGKSYLCQFRTVEAVFPSSDY